MALTPKLEIKQSQSLLLTPQLRQAINLLQMTNLELNDVLSEELNSNPLLEREEDFLTAQAEEKAVPDIDDYGNEQSSFSDENLSGGEETDYQNEFDDYGSDKEGYADYESDGWQDYGQAKISRDDDNPFDFIEKRASSGKSLYDIIGEQIEIAFSQTKDRMIGFILFEQLDDAGYFRGDLDTIAAKLRVNKEYISKILERMKHFEPAGIFAESLEECLRIQLADTGELSDGMSILLDNLELLAARKFKELEKLCNCGQDDLLNMISKIRSVNPKPTAEYFAERNQEIIPDVLVRRNKLGEYLVALNPQTLPRLLINRRYISQISKDTKSNKYIKENLSKANFLIKALNQRAGSILKVSEEIVLRQYNFLEKGVEYIRPMTLKDISEAIGVNESTVSRVVSGKYMQTPRGVFELKYFFSAAAGSYLGDEDTSTITIKHKIKNLIDNEKPEAILSDDAIAAILGQEGIKIARRTIAKYREQMQIGTSGERKRLKRL